MTGDAAQPEPANVENPMIGMLRALKSSVESAVAGVPDIESPTTAIGAGTAWTGTRADAVHTELSGFAANLKSCLTELPHDVQDAIDAVNPKLVTATEAKLIRINVGEY